MLMVMGVSLYTTRIVLDVLGVEDFGIYNVVAGFVSMFMFLNGALSAATSRFMSYELGKRDLQKLEAIFRTSFTIHVILALIILVFLLSGGFWLLNTKLVIPPERLTSANVIFIFSIIGAIISIIQVPFTATIIANEKMKIYAYIGIFDVLLRLVLVFLLKTTSHDRLIMYGFLMLLIAISIYSVYWIFCKRNFQECKVAILFDKTLLRTMLTYSSWSFIGSFSATIKTQGINVLINIFFGPTVNAARGIAFQIHNAIGQFAQNFIIASNPQIIKYYASNNTNMMLELVMKVAKFSFFLMLLIGIPFILETKFILGLWLKEIPHYTVIFVRLIIVNLLLEGFSYPMGTSIQATGKIKLYQLVIGGIISLNLPITYTCFKLGSPPESSVVISICLTLISLLTRVVLIKHKIPELNGRAFIVNVFIRSLLVAALSFASTYSVYSIMPSGFIRLVAVTSVGVLTTVLFILLIGLNKSEQHFLFEKTRKILLNKK